jgi:hypothetical protein
VSLKIHYLIIFAFSFYNNKVQLLDQIVPQLYEIKALAQNQVKVRPKTPDSYRIITKALLDRNMQFHTFKPKDEQT